MSTALITPSFRGDLERCRLLVESVNRHVPPAVTHHLVIDRRDRDLFQDLAGPRTKIHIVEDIVPWWLRRVPPQLPLGSKLWINLRGKPVRNWMLQQIVKLSSDSIVAPTVDRIMFVDSDVFFVRPWDPAPTESSAAVLFREKGLPLQTDFNTEWHRTAHRLLGLPEPTVDETQVGFVSNLLCWRRPILDQLHGHIKATHGKDWVQTIAPLPTLSEYVLYGVFVERVLGFEVAKHDPQPASPCATEWGDSVLDRSALEALRHSVRADQVAVMVSAKSKTPVDLIRSVFADQL
jgi:hypothetical protein